MTIWKFPSGKGAYFWNECLSKGIIAIGWEDVNDLTWIENIEELSERCRQVGYGYRAGRSADLQLWEFKNIEVNDIIVAYGKGKILGLGIN